MTGPQSKVSLGGVGRDHRGERSMPTTLGREQTWGSRGGGGGSALSSNWMMEATLRTHGAAP